jgi:hypothetical protein
MRELEQKEFSFRLFLLPIEESKQYKMKIATPTGSRFSVYPLAFFEKTNILYFLVTF